MIACSGVPLLFRQILISILSVALVALGLGRCRPVFLGASQAGADLLGDGSSPAFNVTSDQRDPGLLFVHMFDTAGTLVGVAQRAW